MGLKLYLKKFKSCCQSKSDYFEKSSIKNENRVSAEDFLKKKVDSDDSNILNEKYNGSSILNDEKMNESKHVEIDEASILSDENINQLRRRNPRLNKFDTDVIRLSLRKSLYANNLEQDLENFLKEQQRETKKYESSQSPYSISDLRELYDLINNITIKDDVGSNNSDNGKSETMNNLDNNNNNNKNSPEILNCKEKTPKIDTKFMNNISNDNKNLLINNSITDESNNLFYNSLVKDVEVNGSTSKNKIKQLSNNMQKSTDLSCTEALYQINNNEPLDNSHDILCSSPVDEITESNNHICTSPQQVHTELICESFDEYNNEKHNNDVICESPKDELDSENHNILCSSPQQDYNDVICESPKDEFDGENHNILCSSPQQDYNDVMCESPKDEFDGENHNILCSSPQQDYNDVMCESPKDEFDGENHNILCSSPQQDYNDVVCESPEEELYNEKHNALCSSPDMICQSPEDYINDKHKINKNITDKICESPTHESSKPVRKSTGFELNSFGSFNSLRNRKDKPPQDSQRSAPTTPTAHDRDLLYSHLKMTEISKKDDDNSLFMHSMLNSTHSLEEKYKNSLSSKSSTLNSDLSVYSYDGIQNLSSRKYTRRGLKVLNSRDTLDNRVKPINLKPRNRKALLIGINYKGKPYQLNGCINDANFILKFLMRNYDFKRDNCKIMTDDSKDKSLIPTRENMINAMKWLVKDAKPGDSLFFHYSGHGLSIKDHDGDEIDGMDESILPLDYEENGVILDDLIHEIMVKPLPKGCLLTALADCCHSGTVFDLPYSYKCNGEIENVKEMDEDNKEIEKEYLTNEIYKKNKMVQKIVNRNTSQPPISLSLEERISIDNYAKLVKHSEADVIQFSSCRDNEISADEKSNGNTYGALCYAFISSLSSVILEEKTISYLQLLIEIRTIIKKKYGQTPQITTCRPMDINKPFEL